MMVLVANMVVPTTTARPRVANLSTLRRLRAAVSAAARAAQAPRPATTAKLTTLQEANPRNLPEVWFRSTFPFGGPQPVMPNGGSPPPDPRKVKLGKTLRILQERLPTLLESPLPQEILAPNISLHLFPSTHQHLPVVSGRVAYIAALWTSPIAWNRVPLIGNNRLEILSERMVDQPIQSTPRRTGATGEQLVVRWRSLGGGNVLGLGGGDGGDTSKEFVGLFIFDFDIEGRILSHTIETVQEGGHWEKGVGAKVVGLTDWLLGNIRRGGAPEGSLAAYHAPRLRRRR
ncbi:hypothetical protein MCOR25_006778 [Pyricularia grisea]|uniref:Chromosome transmission fidelity protein 4 n=1 Tax=Pyricularia grisea TaxID=148305 RepID=A0A6P8B4P4_PYRGI|nr:hypothetical protein PgNI_06047 [Pyricularia grisea]KAI6360278.1 hypothetical protein MCOR25_006778 [Pyricularia grisea]TLD10277.1 hypothetical protein PgNI_06047 [Pyricularia grisea]